MNNLEKLKEISVSPPTEKQIAFVEQFYRDSSEAANFNRPKYTKQAYTNFISEVIIPYYEEMRNILFEDYHYND